MNHPGTIAPPFCPFSMAGGTPVPCVGSLCMGSFSGGCVYADAALALVELSQSLDNLEAALRDLTDKNR